MTISRVATIYNLKLIPGDTRVVFHDYLLSDEISMVEKYLSSPQFVAAIGSHSHKNLRDNCHFFTTGEIDEKIDILEVSNRGISVLQELTNFLWYIKDNSCNILNHYTHIPSQGNAVLGIEKNSNFTTCKATIEEVEFSKDEILKAAEILFAAHNLATSVKHVSVEDFFKVDGLVNNSGMTSSGMNKIDYGLRNRVERAILFMGTVRAAAFIPMKIALGMNVLECLFSDTSSGDIIHKIAERTAFYIGDSTEDRITSFKLVKDAYNVRSKYFHGQKLDKKEYNASKLEDISVKTDNLLRRVLTNVIMVDSAIFTSSDEELSKWFTNLIFKK